MSVESGRGSSGSSRKRSTSKKSASSSSGSASRGRAASSGSRSAAASGGTSRSRTTAKRSTAKRSTAKRSTASGSTSKRSTSNGSASKRSTANGGASKRTTAGQSSGSTRAARQSSSQASSNGHPEKNGRGAVAKIGVPVVSGAIGIAGGVLLGRTALQRNRKVLGIPVPKKTIDFNGVTQEIGKAGKQFGKLADEVRKGTAEVRSAREKAEQIARIFT